MLGRGEYINYTNVKAMMRTHNATMLCHACRIDNSLEPLPTLCVYSEAALPLLSLSYL